MEDGKEKALVSKRFFFAKCAEALVSGRCCVQAPEISLGLQQTALERKKAAVAALHPGQPLKELERW